MENNILNIQVSVGTMKKILKKLNGEINIKINGAKIIKFL
jgi:hypothetical protein